MSVRPPQMTQCMSVSLGRAPGQHQGELVIGPPLGGCVSPARVGRRFLLKMAAYASKCFSRRARRRRRCHAAGRARGSVVDVLLRCSCRACCARGALCWRPLLARARERQRAAASAGELECHIWHGCRQRARQCSKAAERVCESRRSWCSNVRWHRVRCHWRRSVQEPLQDCSRARSHGTA